MNFTQQIRHALQSSPPLLALSTSEEGRALAALEQALENRTIRIWSCLDGFGDQLSDPVQALCEARKSADTVFVFKDLQSHFEQPAVLRGLRELYYDGLQRQRLVVLIGLVESIPSELRDELRLIRPAPPSADELTQLVSSVFSTPLPHEQLQTVVLALRGLTINQAHHVLRRVANAAHSATDTPILREIFDAKEELIGQSGPLQFVPPQGQLSHVGGLDKLTNWIHKRTGLFTQAALDAGSPIPRGILMMGVSGCGKSLVAKIVASTWKLPLFRLDMNVIYSGACGSPEATFHQALQTIESVAPAVLWIDELENGLGSREDGGFEQSHIFSAFLTWMQEKPPLIFVAATANRIEMLPAEILRKGRFDQVFFCDLPANPDREQIIKIHLRAHSADPAEFDLAHLVTATEGWTGAEIEEAIRSARIDAQQAERPMTGRDIGRHIRSMVPLSETMSEQIKALRNWAFGRATLASSHKRR